VKGEASGVRGLGRLGFQLGITPRPQPPMGPMPLFTTYFAVLIGGLTRSQTFYPIRPRTLLRYDSIAPGHSLLVAHAYITTSESEQLGDPTLLFLPKTNEGNRQIVAVFSIRGCRLAGASLRPFQGDGRKRGFLKCATGHWHSCRQRPAQRSQNLKLEALLPMMTRTLLC
jgi:hypothetical protein